MILGTDEPEGTAVLRHAALHRIPKEPSSQGQKSGCAKGHCANQTERNLHPEPGRSSLSIPPPVQLSGQGGSQAPVASGHLQGLWTWALLCSHTFHSNQTTTGTTKATFGKTAGETSQQGTPSFSMPGLSVTYQLSFHLCPPFKNTGCVQSPGCQLPREILLSVTVKVCPWITGNALGSPSPII